ncbi:MAG TPA: adenylate/guanylate cyclase domain-containing protein [Verrucomicrobiae bacterium]|nr:adenylate/guanylate cyclase domain-containing protein [Verrucomicrobiae bacterium]
MDIGGFHIVALLACGMGAAVWGTDSQSPTSRALGVFLAAMGGVIFVSIQVPDTGTLPEWTRILGVLDAVAFIAGVEWGVRVGETVASSRLIRPGRLMLRAAQVVIALYAVVIAWQPDLRARALGGSLDFDLATDPELAFYLVAAPWVLAVGLVSAAGVRLLREQPDKAEAARIMSMLVVMPLFALGLALPDAWAPLSIALGEIVFLVGALRYHTVQGARGQFMAQFLSPQVAELVRKRGLKNAMARERRVVTVISCDIRGFTGYAQGTSPDRVMRLLRDFYGAVGAAATAYGGTIKDLAGDGALILVGAPVAFDDQPVRGLALARHLQERARRVVRKYSTDMGLGVGVATGEVAVGIVGQGARYEYVAVGPAVNLASRLCDEARDGEIRVDAATLEAAGETLPVNSELRPLKGVGREVPTYVIDT